MTFDEFLANIKNRYKQYDNAGLIDDLSVYENVVYALKSLGLLVLEKGTTVVSIKGGKGKLPSGFSKLTKAIKCNPFEYECEDEEYENILQNQYFFAVKDIKRTDWSGCNPCDEKHTEEVIVESVYFRGRKKGTVRYNKPTYVKLTDYVKKNMCDKDCINKNIKNSQYEISIKGNTLYANFNEGNILIEYKGLEEDDDGFIVIPDSDMGHLYKYVEAYVGSELMFTLIANSDNTTNEMTLYQELLRQTAEYKSLATVELKFKGLDKAFNKYKRVVKKEFNTFNF